MKQTRMNVMNKPMGWLNVTVILLVVFAILVTACKKKDDDDDVVPPPPPAQTSIPPDANATPPPTLTDNTLNNIIPNASFAASSGDANRIQMVMGGIKDPKTNQYIALSGTGTTNQTCWLQLDGTNKGILVTKGSARIKTLSADIVFTVDNSGSMGEEADSIAKQITSFANYLATVLNVKVGCVGYDGSVNGAVNLTSATTLNNYLNRTSYGYPIYGTSRTMGFYGKNIVGGVTDSARLEGASYNFNGTVWGENGIVGIEFADTMFNWTTGAQRVYINFTDEGIQPNGNTRFCLNGFKNYWTTAKGTVHSVFSIDEAYWANNVPDTSMEHNNYTPWNASYERPWKLSEYTGGTVQFIHSNCNDLNLRNLPVTGSLAETVMIEFLKPAGAAANRKVKLFIKNNASNSSDGAKEFNVNF